MPYLSGPMLCELSQKFGCYIVQSIAEVWNDGSDSHGLGSKKVNISDYHARLALNSSSIMAEFILSYKNKNLRTIKSVSWFQMEPLMRIGLMTYSLRGCCSTNWAIVAHIMFINQTQL